MIYLTFNDTYSGIYQSQVIDVVKFLNNNFELEIELIAFVPRSLLEDQKKKILFQYPNAKVYPITFGLSRWKWMRRVLKKHLKYGKKCIARGPLAASLALDCSENVIYDGRAAVKAEVEEYNITGGNVSLNKDFIEAERKAVVKSKFRIAVSKQLIQYWNFEFGYSEEEHVIIPCTLSKVFPLTENELSNDVRLIYSGGVSPWQSFELVVHLLRKFLTKNQGASVVFLTKEHKAIDELIKDFEQRVKRKWLAHEDVDSELAEADYGILIREHKKTNEVASPVKFAEYLNAGLKVLISEGIGDFSGFVQENEAGIVVDNEDIPVLDQVSFSEKVRMNNLAKTKLYKDSEAMKIQYQILVDQLKA